MSARQPGCFISHTWHGGQHHFAMRLAGALRRKRIRAWVDEEQIRPGDSITHRVTRAIELECDVFLFILSPEALASKWCVREFKLALNRTTEDYMPIISVLLKDCKIPKFLKNICYADFRSCLDFDTTIQRLVEGIEHCAKLKQVCRHLSDDDPDKRIAAAEKLGDIGDIFTLGLLRYRLLVREFDGKVKHSLAQAIGKIGSSKAVEILVQAMGEKDLLAGQGIEWSTTEALKKLKKTNKREFDRTLNLFENVLKSDNKVVRQRTARVLINLNTKTARVESILYGLLSDSDEKVRRMIEEYFQKERRTL